MDNDLFTECGILLSNGKLNELRKILFEDLRNSNDLRVELIRGLYYLNIKNNHKASEILWELLITNPLNPLIMSNINLLPEHYANRTFKIFIDYDVDEVALKFINNMVLNKNINIYVSRENYKKLENVKVNIIDGNTTDLCIRIKQQTDFKNDNISDKTLIVVLNCNNIQNLNNIYSTEINLMTFDREIKRSLQNLSEDIGDDIITLFDDGIDYTRHKVLTNYEISKVKQRLNFKNEVIFLVKDTIYLDMIINEFNKLYIINKNIKVFILTNRNKYNKTPYVINIDNITHDIYNIVDCYVTLDNDYLTFKSYGAHIVNNKDKLLEHMVDMLFRHEKNYENIGYYYANHNFKNVANNLIDGYLNAPLYLKLLINSIDSNIDRILRHTMTEIDIIQNYLIKLIGYENVYVRLDTNLINKLVNLNYYMVTLEIQKHETNDMMKNFIFNNYGKLLDYRINNLYKSLIMDSMVKCVEAISRKQNVYDNIYELLNRYDFSNYYCMLPNTYFLSTYISKEISRKCKSNINKNIQNALIKNNFSFESKPEKIDDKYRIAIVGIKGDFKGNAVYKFIRQHILSLSKYFIIDLLVEDMGNEEFEINEELQPYINSIYSVKVDCALNQFRDFYNGKLDITKRINNFDKIKENNYFICYFLAMGCSISSIYLSNIQIAPYQLSGYGHPISTFNSKNNYYIMSPDIENIDRIKMNYTENPLFVNKLTTNPITPSFELPEKVEKKNNHICLSCTFKKLTPDFIYMLNCISIKWNKENNNKLVYHFFTGPCGFIIDSTTLLDSTVKSNNYDSIMEYSTKTFDNYMATKNICYLAFDSYPYAGFTTILENLRLGLPTIVYEGNEVVNRFPSYFYKNMDLEELIVKSEKEYIDLAIRLLTDKEYYNSVKEKVDNIDVDKYLENIYDEESLINSFIGLIDNYENI